MSARKILVIRGGALGDFILTLPVLAALRRHFPDRPLEILGYPRIASLAVAGGLADRVSAIESPTLTGFFAPDGSWPSSAAEYFDGFDLIISYLYDPEGIFRRNVARVTSAQFIAGTHRPDEVSRLHATEILLQPLKVLGIENADPCPRLVLPETGPMGEGPWLAVHPGSGSESKNWPEAKWAELLQRLAGRTRWNVLLISGEAEGGRGRRLSALFSAGRMNLIQNSPLVQLAQKMKSCAAYLGHDSGITHLAAALDLPGLVLWGLTSAATWRPRSDKMRLLRDSTDLSALPVDTVERELAPSSSQYLR